MVHACACACVRATTFVTTRVCAGAVCVFLIENVRARFVRPFACWGVYAPRVDLRVMVIFNLRLVSYFTVNLDVFACFCFFALTVNVQGPRYVIQ